MSKRAPSSIRQLTTELRKLGDEVTGVDDEGEPVTRFEKLAERVWDYALGYHEQVRDEKGRPSTIYHPPVAWAAQYIFERVEGKAPQAPVEAVKKIKVADKVAEMAKRKINELAGIA